MKYAFIFILIFLVMPSLCFGQIELNSTGQVVVGPESNHTAYRLRVEGGSSRYGIYVDSDGTVGQRYGILSYARNSVDAYGVYGRAEFASGKNWGVVGYADGTGESGATVYGIYGAGYPSATSYAGYFVGDVHSTGTVTWVSDEKLKENVTSLDGRSTLDRLMQLRPSSYTSKQTSEFADLNLRTGIQYGLIAQEVEGIFPELVSDHVYHPVPDIEGRDTGASISYKGMNYIDLIPLLLSAIQEQQAEIEAMRAALSANGISVNR